MTAVISTMSFKGLLRRSGHDNYIPEGSLRNGGSLWHRRSLSGERSSSGVGSGGSKRQQNLVTSLATLPRGQRQVMRSRSNSLVDYTDPQRTAVALEKQDNETFGFEVQTYGLQQKNSSTVEMCTFVCKVQEHSPAETAGLAPGDIIVTINGVCTEGSSHQRIVGLIRESANVLTLETVSGAVVKRIELEKKLKLLKQRLTAKWVELQRVTLQEQRLTCGDMNVCSPHLSLDSPMSLASPVGCIGLRFSSDSSCRSVASNGDCGDGDLPCVFDEPGPFSPHLPAAGDTGCFFPWDPESRTSLSRTRSSSLAGSSGSLSPSWDAAGACSLFGTLPRKARRGSVRRRIMKFIPGLNRPVEEEENI